MRWSLSSHSFQSLVPVRPEDYTHCGWRSLDSKPGLYSYSKIGALSHFSVMCLVSSDNAVSISCPNHKQKWSTGTGWVNNTVEQPSCTFLCHQGLGSHAALPLSTLELMRTFKKPIKISPYHLANCSTPLPRKPQEWSPAIYSIQWDNLCVWEDERVDYCSGESSAKPRIFE